MLHQIGPLAEDLKWPFSEALFHGCTLEAWYHNSNGCTVCLRSSPSIGAFLKQLGSIALGPNAPAAILRYESGGKPREGVPMGGMVAEVLSLIQAGELLEKVAKEEIPSLEAGDLSGLWTLQSYVEPRYGIRILSVYSCDANLEERSDIFSHRFRSAAWFARKPRRESSDVFQEVFGGDHVALLFLHPNMTS